MDRVDFNVSDLKRKRSDNVFLRINDFNINPKRKKTNK